MITLARNLNLQSVGLHNDGEIFNNMPAAVKRLKDGARGISNSVFDRLFMKDTSGYPSKEQRDQVGENFLKFPLETQKQLIRGWVVTDTLMVKNKGDERLGEKIVFGNDTYTITFMVNKNFQKEYGLVADLTSDNFHLETSADMKRITISDLREEDIRPTVFSEFQVHRGANDSTLWVPSRSITDSLDKRRFEKIPNEEVPDHPFVTMDCPLVTLAARRFLVHDPSMIFVLRGHGAYEYVADVIGALFITHPFTLLEDISQHEGADKIWKPCTKNAVLLHYRGVNGEKEIIHTWEGDLVALRERDYIIKGLEGEEYPIEKSLFSRLYMIGDSPGKS